MGIAGIVEAILIIISDQQVALAVDRQIALDIGSP